MHLTTLALAPLLALSLDASAGDRRAPDRGTSDPRVTVMTRNLYPGIDDPTPILAAVASGDVTEILMAVEAAWQQLCATDFPTRSAAIADEIATRKPQVIALQEVALWRTQLPADFDPAPNAEDVAYDFLETLLSDLRARGLHYEAIAVRENLDIELPRWNDGEPQDVRWTDRDVLLARVDLPASELAVLGHDSGWFTAVIDLGGGLGVPRGWVSADVMIRGRIVHVVGTHLEDMDTAVTLAQAQELVAGPAASPLPTILLGDFNSNARHDETSGAYELLAAEGFADAWLGKGAPLPGFTCCQDPSLTNAESQLSTRVDLVFSRNGLEVASTALTGEKPQDRVTGLWPSDHAGLFAAFRLPDER